MWKPARALGVALLLSLVPAVVQAKPAENFLFMGSGELDQSTALLARPDIAGAQVVYTWRQLEPEKGEYDFSAIEADLALTERSGRKLFLQIQDRFFLPKARNVPDYILTEPVYRGGLARQADNPGEGKPMATGWVAKQWHAPVQERFHSLLSALAERFDGRVFGINLPETAADLLDPKAEGFSCDAYFKAEMANAAFARTAFRKSHVVQYINFWPCEWDNDRKYMSRFFAFAKDNKVGLGGPDIVPYRKGQMKNAYPFFNAYKGQLPLVTMAVQQPTLTYTNPQTGKRFTKSEIEDFADDYLGVDVIFWTTEAPWLKDLSSQY